MASCDDDFPLLDDHQNPNPAQASSAQTPPYQIGPYDPEPDPFESDPDPSSASGKRFVDRDDNNGGTSKRTRLPSAGSSGDYRKDREEWSDTAIAYLLEAYSDKFLQLKRGNLRGRDWEEVAAVVSERCDNQMKSVEQCKNKVDNLKKRYKLERHRMAGGGNVPVSHWPWFKQMERIVGNSISTKVSPAVEDEKSPGGGGGGSYSSKQYKRLGTPTNSSGGQINTMKSKPSNNLRWRRVVFKISGSTLARNAPNNIDPEVVTLIAKEVLIACKHGVEVAIVVGGRNFFCEDAWVTSTGLDRCTAHQIGMMATVMNSILLQSALEKVGVQTRVQSSFSMPEVAEPYNRQRAIRHLEKGRVVIFGGIGASMGNPLFTTDTSAALRATEIHADAILKGTNVDCVYVCDSRNNSIAAEHISFRELAARGASPMDLMAMTFCEDNRIPVGVFNLHEPGNISRALCGERVGTLIDQTGPVS